MEAKRIKGDNLMINKNDPNDKRNQNSICSNEWSMSVNEIMVTLF